MRRLLCVAVLIGGASMFTDAASNTVAVEGGQLRGTTVDGIRTFKGIPFAAPPVGALRWKGPQPVVAWSGVKAADTFGAQCMQQPYPAGSPYASAPQPTSEDCLYLNVWTAAREGEKRPVMVWIHGGGWTRGSGSTAVYDGAILAKKGVVVVTTNYRLGAFGFFAHPELTKESPTHASGNYGILDHIAALKWVQNNIAAFGGDPTRVTIFGESAGSWSVSVVQATPLAKGLFHRAIGESGGQFAGTTTLAQAERRGVAFGTSVSARTLADLRALPADKLLGVESFRTAVNVDGYVLPEDVRSIFARGRQNSVPVLVGSNADEMTTLSNAATFPTSMEEFHLQMAVRFPGFSPQFDAAYPVKTEADIPAVLLALGRDQTFTSEMRTWARMVTAAGQKAFLYQFTHVPPSPNAKTWGAYHASEIAYVFGTLRNRDWKYSQTDFKLSDQMSSYWTNFASGGDPNGKKLPAWTPYDQTEEPYLELGDTIKTKHHLLKAQLDFLDDAALRRRPVAQ
ncbi:MAG TPA: carboxylesterase family protein [Vicinamibacterales bacterium]|nr:carboxylesterase family protein [Vicinamibacterales bacterium]